MLFTIIYQFYIIFYDFCYWAFSWLSALILILCSVLIGGVRASLLLLLSCSISNGYIRITMIAIGLFVSTTTYDIWTTLTVYTSHLYSLYLYPSTFVHSLMIVQLRVSGSWSIVISISVLPLELVVMLLFSILMYEKMIPVYSKLKVQCCYYFIWVLIKSSFFKNPNWFIQYFWLVR